MSDADVPDKREYAVVDDDGEGNILLRCAGCGMLLKELPDDHSHGLTEKQQRRRERLDDEH